MGLAQRPHRPVAHCLGCPPDLTLRPFCPEAQPRVATQDQGQQLAEVPKHQLAGVGREPRDPDLSGPRCRPPPAEVESMPMGLRGHVSGRICPWTSARHTATPGAVLGKGRFGVSMGPAWARLMAVMSPLQGDLASHCLDRA